MVYASQGLIQASDYNGFATTLNNIWGVGSGDSGYGQTGPISTVSPGTGNLITATQWANLINRINNISRHQTGAATSLAAPTAGTRINYLSTLSGAVTTLNTNRLTFVGQGASTSYTVSRLTPNWQTSSIKEVSITFASANAMRYYFNAGGQITFTSSLSTFGTDAKDLSFTTLVAAAGTILIRAQTSAKIGGSGTPAILNTNAGFYDLTTSYTTVLQQFSTNVGYTTNYILYDVRLNDAPGAANIIYVRSSMFDIVAGLLTVNGTSRIDVTQTPPSTTFLTDSWGTPTFATVTDTQA